MRKIWIILGFWLGIAPQISAAQLRPMVYDDTRVEAGIEEVWTDWTTAEGLESFFAPRAIVDGTIGGTYEVWFAPDAPKGQRGAEDGVLLGWQRDSADGTRMISFSWKMPPYMEEISESMTVVQLWMIPVDDDTTRLRLFHTGFGDTEAWLEAERYFETTWPEVLAAYAKHVAETD
ncbi:SRPBCC domain-containing protein [Litorimonas sp. RW-G-Af-16]|uniref:SRPBCC family protein n=1 Tax=Litorimonas sp. RW-G-Af-16 TaxID=3241168 RepID=UPI003AB0809E